MPTGYTSKLMEKGQSFDEFVLTCARSFGALVMLRDEPLDAPIPERFEPSDWYARELTKARASLSELQAMTEDQRLAFGNERKAEKVAKRGAWLRRDEEANARLCEMEAQVLRWQPPTVDHQGLKDFMLQQIEVSKNNTAYILREIEAAKRMEPLAFYREAVDDARRDIRYHSTHHDEEVARVQQRNDWVRQLRESLGQG